MKVNKRICKVIIALISSICMLLMCQHGIDVIASDTNVNRMNVVFVMDCSGSMNYTDKGNFRFEALDLFLGLSAEEGNYMGLVAFDDSIVLQEDIRRIDGNSAKSQLSSQMRSVKNNGDTDIGHALEYATEMLQKNGNPDLPSVIILLSDGNTDLGHNESALQASRTSKSNAIATCQANGYKVYAVCLNTDGSADVSELEEISESTGGSCVEVSRAEDLKEVFNQFYSIIYSADTINLADREIGDDGELNIPFHIPMIGVEEANIIINTLNSNTSYTLFRPGDYAYTDDELEQMTIHAKTFAIIKIQAPEAGDWNLRVRGIPGDQVRIDMVYNVNLGMTAEISPVVSTLGVGEGVDVIAKMYNQNGVVNDQSVYNNCPFTLRATNKTTGEVNEYTMNAGNEGTEYRFIADKTGEFDLQVFCNIEDMELQSNVIGISANNNAPVTNVQEVVIEKKISKFAKSVIYIEDLSQYVSDVEDSTLAFSLDSALTTADPGLIVLNGQNLEMDLAALNDKELIGIVATDSQGASVCFNVKVDIKRVLPVWVFILPILFILVIAAFVVFKIITGSKVIRGKIHVYGFNEDGLGSPETFDGAKGKMCLRRYIDDDMDTGINLSKVWVMAGSKDSQIILLSADGLYSDANPETKLKKIKVDGEIETSLSSSIEMDRGIKITYIPEETDY